jgi:parallel beta-helix repeat protein
MMKNLVLVVLLLLGTTFFLTLPAQGYNPPPTPPPAWYVAPTPTGTGVIGGSCSRPGFNTIGDAIAHASAGDTINVCTGTYIEQIIIDKSLTLQAAAKSTPTIQAPTTMTPDPTFLIANIVTITGATTIASFSGFTVTGPSTYPGACVQNQLLVSGIFVSNGATATITHNIIAHIREEPLATCQTGRAVLIGVIDGRWGPGTTGHAMISDNKVFDYQKSGIDIESTGSTATITHNTVTGVGPTALIAQNGIEVIYGAVATVDSNRVSGNECNNPTCGPDFLTQDSAAGILLYQSGAGTKVTQNTVSANDKGIWVQQADSATTVKENTATNNRYAGIALFDGSYGASFNMVAGPGNVGIAAVAATVNTSATLSKNIIIGVTASIGAYAGPGLTATILSS